MKAELYSQVMGGKRVADDELFIVYQGKRHRAGWRPCEYCGMPFLAMLAAQPGAGRFCSRTCARSRKTEARFWAKVVKSDGCWEWQGSRDGAGYGVLGASRHYPAARAHRVSWTMHNGRPVPEGMFILHHCDNPPCVRPDHLYAGSLGDNARDRASRHRGRESRQHGEANPNAKLTDDDVCAIKAAVSGGETQLSLARRYGVSQPYVSRIVREKNRLTARLMPAPGG